MSETRPKVILEDGVMKIDIAQLAGDYMTTEEKVRLAECLAIQEDIIEAVVDLLVNDMTSEHSCWVSSTGHSPLEKARVRLMASMDKLRVQAVKKIVQDRDRAEKEYKRADQWAWALWHEINKRGGDAYSYPKQDDFEYTPCRENDEIIAILDAAQVAPHA